MVDTIERALPVEVIVVSDDTYIEFFDSGIFIIYDTFEVPSVIEGNGNSSTNSSGKYTSTRKSQADAYNILGYIIVSVWAEGYFWYDGKSTPTPYMTDYDYAKYGFLNAWGVDNWSGSTSQNHSNNTARFSASGNFYWGITWSGNGWKIQNYHIVVGFGCNKNGTLNSLLKGFY